MSEIDRELESAWRAASREEPPSALDAAIRAAARREVGAGPARARHMRWWPVAAAAVVAVIAVGIVELTPPEQVTPTTVADSSLVASAAKKDSDKLFASAAPATVAPARSAVEPATEAGGAERAGNVLRKQLAQAPVVTQPAARGTLEEKNATAPSAADANINAQLAAAPERDRVLKSKTEMAAAPVESTAPVARGEPFPAAPPAARSAANAPAPAAPPVEPAAAKPMAAPSGGALAARTDEAPSGGPAARAKLAAVDRERAKDVAPRPADEWIKLIRRLKSEGRNEEATKELAAFRAAYKDRSDALLPADLRETKP